ncbi:MAG: LuxR family transcriptional regulator [Pseudomonadota bacterium]
MTAQLGQIGFFEAAPGMSAATLHAQIAAFLSRNELKHYSFVQLHRGTCTQRSQHLNLHTNYDGAWVDRYMSRRYDQVDPVCELGRKATKPFWWGGARFLSNFEKRQKRVFWEAEDFGIVHGVSIPVRAIDGALGLVSFTAASANDIASVLKQAGPQLHVAAHQLTDLLVERADSDADAETPLSARERETLIWVVQGMTSEEIADRMLLSVSAINYHLGKAKRKMNARNRHHAALLAMSKGLV